MNRKKITQTTKPLYNIVIFIQNTHRSLSIPALTQLKARYGGYKVHMIYNKKYGSYICYVSEKFSTIPLHRVWFCARQAVIVTQQGAVSIRKTVLPGMAIPMLKIRRPNGRLIFNMEIAIRR